MAGKTATKIDEISLEIRATECVRLGAGFEQFSDMKLFSFLHSVLQFYDSTTSLFRVLAARHDSLLASTAPNDRTARTSWFVTTDLQNSIHVRFYPKGIQSSHINSSPFELH